MGFQIESTHLGEIVVLAPQVFEDERGFFLEAFRADEVDRYQSMWDQAGFYRFGLFPETESTRFAGRTTRTPPPQVRKKQPCPPAPRYLVGRRDFGRHVVRLQLESSPVAVAGGFDLPLTSDAIPRSASCALPAPPGRVRTASQSCSRRVADRSAEPRGLRPGARRTVSPVLPSTLLAAE